MLTQKQLVQILGNPESYNIEITSSTTNMDKFCQAICAFSNDLPGDDKSGYLIIGAEDNGKLSGLRVDDGLLLKMTNIRTDGNILPGVTRRSCIELLKSWGMPVEERKVSIDEVLEAHDNGHLNEAFGTGTAAVISPVGELYDNGKSYVINNNEIGPVGWTVKIK